MLVLLPLLLVLVLDMIGNVYQTHGENERYAALAKPNNSLSTAHTKQVVGGKSWTDCVEGRKVQFPELNTNTSTYKQTQHTTFQFI
jgi:hypothetical protein